MVINRRRAGLATRNISRRERPGFIGNVFSGRLGSGLKSARSLEISGAVNIHTGN
jgi:hypothetical protein